MRNSTSLLSEQGALSAESALTLAQLETVVSAHCESIEQLIRDNIPSLGPKSKLRDACEYALTNGGKRFRPMLVNMVAAAVNPNVDVSQAALAVEYFHTASLIADDLPCMDNDAERRNKPAAHIAFGEPTALLASYALIAAGYDCLAKNSQTLAASTAPHAGRADAIGLLAVQNISRNTGLQGASGGQFLDIFPPDLSWPTIHEVICKKTVSLFDISFVLGWLYAGGSIALLPQVSQAAYHFGVAFQIADDLGDIKQDALNGRNVNAAAIYGCSDARALVLKEIELYRNTLRTLDIGSAELYHLPLFLEAMLH